MVPCSQDLGGTWHGVTLSEPAFISIQTSVTQLGHNRTGQPLQLCFGFQQVGQTGHQPLWTPQALLCQPPPTPPTGSWEPSAPPAPTAQFCPLPSHLQAPGTCQPAVVTCHRLPAISQDRGRRNGQETGRLLCWSLGPQGLRGWLPPEGGQVSSHSLPRY